MIETAPAVLELGLLLLGAVVAGYAARRVGLPAVVGYVLLGLLVSPFTPGFVADRERLQLLADLGVVLLLYEVGIEVDPSRIRSEHRRLLVAAPLQVLATTGIAALAFVALGVPPVPAMVLGLAVALSSSVVVANITRSRRRTTDPETERALIGWAVLQDVTAVALAGALLAALGSGRTLAVELAALGIFTLLSLVVARLMPVVLRALVGQPDLLVIVSFALGLAIAGAGAVIFEVPLALAAFVGGLVVTESDEAAELRRQLFPFRDLLAVLFFVAIGTLVDPAALVRGAGWLALFVALVVVGKVGVAYLLARFVARLDRPAQVAVGLGQVGEFSFVLASALVAAGQIDAETYAAILVAVALTIAASAVLVRLPVLAQGARAIGGPTTGPDIPA